MKKLIMMMALMMCFTLTYSQLSVIKVEPKITVGEIKLAGGFMCDLTYQVSDKDTTYTIMYRNAKYSSIVSIESFHFSGNKTFNDFYLTLKSFFSEENIKNKEYKLEINLDGKQMILANNRMMGVTSIMIYTIDGYFYLTNTQVDKLFGKITE